MTLIERLNQEIHKRRNANIHDISINELSVIVGEYEDLKRIDANQESINKCDLVKQIELMIVDMNETMEYEGDFTEQYFCAKRTRDKLESILSETIGLMS